MLEYEFGLREVETALTNLRDEFQHIHEYNPIEHVSSRVKSPESLACKAARRGVPTELACIREAITDIAGVRVTCCMVRDVYRLAGLLTERESISVRKCKDYITDPKPNGYRSLHLVLDVSVRLSSGPIVVPVEVQFRTIAMDFWASLEHRIYYKYDGYVPQQALQDLRDAADTAAALDARMERLHLQLHGEELDDTELQVCGPGTITATVPASSFTAVRNLVAPTRETALSQLD